jgi:hypothetical protein
VLAVEHISQFDQCDVHLCLDRAVDHVVKLLDAMRAPVAASWLGCRRTCGSILAHPAYRGRLADLEALRGSPSRHTTLDSRNQTTAKVLR